MNLKSAQFDTPLGEILAISDDEALYLLEFTDNRGLKREIERLQARTKLAVTCGSTGPISSIEREIEDYFAGSLMEFKTPIHLLGSPFQKQVWKVLAQILYGETRSYKEQAIAIKRPQACRAVANANGANQLAIIIPCHRVINSNGVIGGYGGGVSRKKWLLEHEKGNNALKL